MTNFRIATFRLLNQDRSLINGKRCQLELKFSTPKKSGDDRIRIIGEIHNDTSRSNRLQQQPVRNFSGLVAPYEDAYAQAVANTSGLIVVRFVSTNLGVHSTLVQNYLARNYIVETGNGPYVAAWKEFSPNHSTEN